jgi:hypothetical protein
MGTITEQFWNFLQRFIAILRASGQSWILMVPFLRSNQLRESLEPPLSSGSLKLKKIETCKFYQFYFSLVHLWINLKNDGGWGKGGEELLLPLQ